ncbi:MAG: lamin tail domain-containing protein, partial [Candidatus Zixiibacteriota bacterium]
GSEWVEIKNNSNVAIDLKNWQIGDSLALHTITDSTYLLFPDEYMVVAQDTTDFLNYYSPYNGLLLEPSGWAALNNTFDKIRLVDNHGFVSDSINYASLYSDNFTWALAESGINAGSWGRSQDTGGTPGAMNQVVFTSLGENVTITIAPEHFSPDGDGIDETVQILLEAPESDSYSLRVFDRHGR